MHAKFARDLQDCDVLFCCSAGVRARESLRVCSKAHRLSPASLSWPLAELPRGPRPPGIPQGQLQEKTLRTSHSPPIGANRASLLTRRFPTNSPPPPPPPPPATPLEQPQLGSCYDDRAKTNNRIGYQQHMQRSVACCFAWPRTILQPAFSKYFMLATAAWAESLRTEPGCSDPDRAAGGGQSWNA